MDNPIVDFILFVFELVTGCYIDFEGGAHIVADKPYRMVFSGLVTFGLAIWILVLV